MGNLGFDWDQATHPRLQVRIFPIPNQPVEVITAIPISPDLLPLRLAGFSRQLRCPSALNPAPQELPERHPSQGSVERQL